MGAPMGPPWTPAALRDLREAHCTLVLGMTQDHKMDPHHDSVHRCCRFLEILHGDLILAFVGPDAFWGVVHIGPT